MPLLGPGGLGSGGTGQPGTVTGGGSGSGSGSSSSTTTTSTGTTGTLTQGGEIINIGYGPQLVPTGATIGPSGVSFQSGAFGGTATGSGIETQLGIASSSTGAFSGLTTNSTYPSSSTVQMAGSQAPPTINGVPIVNQVPTNAQILPNANGAAAVYISPAGESYYYSLPGASSQQVEQAFGPTGTLSSVQGNTAQLQALASLLPNQGGPGTGGSNPQTIGITKQQAQLQAENQQVQLLVQQGYTQAQAKAQVQSQLLSNQVYLPYANFAQSLGLLSSNGSPINYTIDSSGYIYSNPTGASTIVQGITPGILITGNTFTVTYNDANGNTYISTGTISPAAQSAQEKINYALDEAYNVVQPELSANIAGGSGGLNIRINADNPSQPPVVTQNQGLPANVVNDLIAQYGPSSKFIGSAGGGVITNSKIDSLPNGGTIEVDGYVITKGQAQNYLNGYYTNFSQLGQNSKLSSEQIFTLAQQNIPNGQISEKINLAGLPKPLQAGLTNTFSNLSYTNTLGNSIKLTVNQLNQLISSGSLDPNSIQGLTSNGTINFTTGALKGNSFTKQELEELYLEYYNSNAFPSDEIGNQQPIIVLPAENEFQYARNLALYGFSPQGTPQIVFPSNYQVTGNNPFTLSFTVSSGANGSYSQPSPLQAAYYGNLLATYAEEINPKDWQTIIQQIQTQEPQAGTPNWYSVLSENAGTNSSAKQAITNLQAYQIAPEKTVEGGGSLINRIESNFAPNVVTTGIYSPSSTSYSRIVNEISGSLNNTAEYGGQLNNAVASQEQAQSTLRLGNEIQNLSGQNIEYSPINIIRSTRPTESTQTSIGYEIQGPAAGQFPQVRASAIETVGLLTGIGAEAYFIPAALAIGGVTTLVPAETVSYIQTGKPLGPIATLENAEAGGISYGLFSAITPEATLIKYLFSSGVVGGISTGTTTATSLLSGKGIPSAQNLSLSGLQGFQLGAETAGEFDIGIAGIKGIGGAIAERFSPDLASFLEEGSQAGTGTGKQAITYAVSRLPGSLAFGGQQAVNVALQGGNPRQITTGFFEGVAGGYAFQAGFEGAAAGARNVFFEPLVPEEAANAAKGIKPGTTRLANTSPFAVQGFGTSVPESSLQARIGEGGISGAQGISELPAGAGGLPEEYSLRFPGSSTNEATVVYYQRTVPTISPVLTSEGYSITLNERPLPEYEITIPVPKALSSNINPEEAQVTELVQNNGKQVIVSKSLGVRNRITGKISGQITEVWTPIEGDARGADTKFTVKAYKGDISLQDIYNGDLPKVIRTRTAVGSPLQNTGVVIISKDTGIEGTGTLRLVGSPEVSEGVKDAVQVLKEDASGQIAKGNDVALTVEKRNGKWYATEVTYSHEAAINKDEGIVPKIEGKVTRYLIKDNGTIKKVGESTQDISGFYNRATQESGILEMNQARVLQQNPYPEYLSNQNTRQPIPENFAGNTERVELENYKSLAELFGYSIPYANEIEARPSAVNKLIIGSSQAGASEYEVAVQLRQAPKGELIEIGQNVGVQLTAGSQAKVSGQAFFPFLEREEQNIVGGYYKGNVENTYYRISYGERGGQLYSTNTFLRNPTYSAIGEQTPEALLKLEENPQVAKQRINQVLKRELSTDKTLNTYFGLNTENINNVFYGVAGRSTEIGKELSYNKEGQFVEKPIYANRPIAIALIGTEGELPAIESIAKPNNEQQLFREGEIGSFVFNPEIRNTGVSYTYTVTPKSPEAENARQLAELFGQPELANMQESVLEENAIGRLSGAGYSREIKPTATFISKNEQALNANLPGIRNTLSEIYPELIVEQARAAQLDQISYFTPKQLETADELRNFFTNFAEIGKENQRIIEAGRPEQKGINAETYSKGLKFEGGRYSETGLTGGKTALQIEKEVTETKTENKVIRGTAIAIPDIENFREFERSREDELTEFERPLYFREEEKYSSKLKKITEKPLKLVENRINKITEYRQRNPTDQFERTAEYEISELEIPLYQRSRELQEEAEVQREIEKEVQRTSVVTTGVPQTTTPGGGGTPFIPNIQNPDAFEKIVKYREKVPKQKEEFKYTPSLLGLSAEGSKEQINEIEASGTSAVNLRPLSAEAKKAYSGALSTLVEDQERAR